MDTILMILEVGAYVFGALSLIVAILYSAIEKEYHDSYEKLIDMSNGYIKNYKKIIRNAVTIGLICICILIGIWLKN